MFESRWQGNLLELVGKAPISIVALCLSHGIIEVGRWFRLPFVMERPQVQSLPVGKPAVAQW